MSPLVPDGAVGVPLDPLVDIASHGGPEKDTDGYQGLGVNASPPSRSVAGKSKISAGSVIAVSYMLSAP